MIRFLLILLVVVLVECDESENPGFFLKITKNVPRIGRRSGVSDFDTFFLKASKSVPRIGRRSQMNDDWPGEGRSWKYDRLIRELRSETPSTPGSYNFVQPFNMKFLFNLLADDPKLDESDLRFISWKDFDEALESDEELLLKLVELGREHNSPEWNKNNQRMIEDDKVMINQLNSVPDGRHGMGSIFYRTERSLNNKNNLSKEVVNPVQHQ